MTISSTTRKAGPYTGNGATVAFPFGFKVFDQTDIVVTATDADGIESTLSLTTHYTVSLNVDQDASPGGTVTMVTAPTAGHLRTITSDVPELQAVALTNMGGFYPAVINAALDRLTILAQQLREEVDRAVKTGVSSSTDPDVLVASLLAAQVAAANSAAAAASSAAAAAAAVPSGSLGYTPVNKTGDTMSGNLALPGINVNGSGVITALGAAATKAVGVSPGMVPLWDYIPLRATSAKAAAYTVVAADRGKVFDCTNTFTLSLDVAATLGDGFPIAVRNSGAGVITIDPNAGELIDDVATITLAPGESCILVCNGTAWKTVGRREPTMIASITTAALATSVTVSGLDINTHKGYRVEIAYVDGAAAAHGISLYINGLTTASDYFSQYIQASGTSVTAARLNTAQIAGCSANGRVVVIADISLAPGGYMFADAEEARDSGGPIISLNYKLSRTAAVANITSLTFSASVANGIGVGTTFRVYRKDN